MAESDAARQELNAVEMEGKDADPAEVGWRRRVRRWLLNATAAGLMLSMVFHLILLLIAAKILLNRPAGEGDTGPIEVELAVMSESELREFQEQLRVESDPSTATSALEDLVEQPFMEMPSVDEAISGKGVSDLSPLGGAIEGMESGFDAPSGAGGAASFFGVEARGSRFAYIIDRSGSMEGPKLEALKQQLITSVDRLTENASFMVYFYSDETRPLGNRTKWISVNERNRQMAAREIRATTAYGGTVPVPAFVEAFQLRPKPDAIYFMTDGIFTNEEQVVSMVADLNARFGPLTPIHTISFVSRDSEEVLRRIAAQSGGTYTHIADPNL
ncbi:MAG: VWA domain-containing protein [Planctomycetota bacterium]|nr:VWA domain-containing protein [Planctomycetota bacterium]